MVEEILKPKIEASGFVDVLGVGLAKVTSEKLIARTPIGNGTLVSGAAKLLGGGLVYGKAGKFGHIVGSGMVIDGVEDIVTALLGGSALGNGGNGSGEPDF